MAKGGCRVGFFEIWRIGSSGYSLSNDPDPRPQFPVFEELWKLKVPGRDPEYPLSNDLGPRPQVPVFEEMSQFKVAGRE
ncbi:hypothetical protein BX616_007969 [Lobosporangium transversale]|nr:hypothetical protein BX616_007969 [Lobosporangium transversale]